MEENKDPVKVIVTGGSYGANTLVFGVVHDALKKAQFHQVRPHISETLWGPTSVTRRVESLLDICRCIHPDLFNTPVEITQDLTDVKFTDDEVYPTTAALEETIHKTVRNDYVDYYTIVTDSVGGNGRHDPDEAVVADSNAMEFGE